MDFFKVKRFRKPSKKTPEDLDDKNVGNPEDSFSDSGNVGVDVENVSEKLGNNVDQASESEEDDEDFITNEVKRRLKELRRNSFMVLIPEEESCPEEEEDEEYAGETCSTEWRDVEAEGRQWWRGLDGVYEKYCERMLFYDKLIMQQLKEAGCYTSTTPSPKSASKKLSSPFRCLSLKKVELPEDETEHLQQPQNDPYIDLETAYVAQMCLTWEALHCQYTHISQKIACQPESPTWYNHSAEQFQQFQVLLQRFIENEPFEQGFRAEVYARARNSLPKLLHVPNIKGSVQSEAIEGEEDLVVRAPELIRIIESSILSFHLFLKMDKKRPNGVNLFGNQNQIATPLHLTQSSLEKKAMKLKELCKKKKNWKKYWPQTHEDVELLFSFIDIKILSRVLKMVRISKDQLIWCEEKMKKIHFSEGKLLRDPSPVLLSW